MLLPSVRTKPCSLNGFLHMIPDYIISLIVVTQTLALNHVTQRASFTQMSADHTYRRLNRCGIDNCKASLYYLEDGQWFCKNGHRREVGTYITGSCRIYP